MYSFPCTLSVIEWTKYLRRKLTAEEISLFDSVRDEQNYNKDLDKLSEIAMKKGLYIPKLTERDGNCLFESLKISGLCTDQDKFRKFLAHMMYIFKNKKNFFSYDSRSLEEMFNDINEVEYVLCVDDIIVYKYTYDTMCQDLASNYSSWTRLPTELIIQFISQLFNVRFEIYSNLTDYVNVLDANATASLPTPMTKKPPTVVYLGHLGERHYVPLEIRTGSPHEDICPKYKDCKSLFITWAKKMAVHVNGVECERRNDHVVDSEQSCNRYEDYVELTRVKYE